MNINKIVLSIVKRPSFNLLAFQAFTFTILAIAGVIGAFQFVPFLGIKDTSAYYFIVYFYIAAGVIIYTSVIFLIGGILKKIHIIGLKLFEYFHDLFCLFFNRKIIGIIIIIKSARMVNISKNAPSRA